MCNAIDAVSCNEEGWQRYLEKKSRYIAAIKLFRFHLIINITNVIVGELPLANWAKNSVQIRDEHSTKTVDCYVSTVQWR